MGAETIYSPVGTGHCRIMKERKLRNCGNGRNKKTDHEGYREDSLRESSP